FMFAIGHVRGSRRRLFFLSQDGRAEWRQKQHGGEQHSSHDAVLLKVGLRLPAVDPIRSSQASNPDYKRRCRVCKRKGRFVKGRRGHDRRYAIEPAKIERELGWRPIKAWESGLLKTISRYQGNGWWLGRIRSGSYREY